MIKQILIAFFFLLASSTFAQFVNGVGLFLSGMASSHKYTDLSSNQSFGSFRSCHIYRVAGGALAEMGRDDYAKWRTEIEYNTMGAKHSLNNEGTEKIFRNKLDYLSWNNFLKLQLETFYGYPYVLLGARCQYLLNNSPEVYQNYLTKVSSFHFSWNVAAGFEFMAYGPFRVFTEYHFMNDIVSLYSGDEINIRSLTHELRVGLIYRFLEKTEKCNTPIYNDNY